MFRSTRKRRARSWTSAAKRLLEGVFACGNALHVNDLVDYVSESGETAGRAAADPIKKERRLVSVVCDESLLYVVPQRFDRAVPPAGRIVYFRSSQDMHGATLTLRCGERILFQKTYAHLRPPEMERLALALPPDALEGEEPLLFHLEAKTNAQA